MFRSDRHPARRYLYFRYVMTYLWAKKQGNQEWVEQVDNKGVFWAFSGPYLEKSTLISLGTRISGFTLPESIIHDKTCDGPEPCEEDKDQSRQMVISLRQANIASSKAQDEEGVDDEDDEVQETEEGAEIEEDD